MVNTGYDGRARHWQPDECEKGVESMLTSPCWGLSVPVPRWTGVDNESFEEVVKFFK